MIESLDTRLSEDAARRGASRTGLRHPGPANESDQRGHCSVIVVGTYPPTECGLATYAANVHDALTACGMAVGVLRVVEGAAPISPPVVCTWSGDSEDDIMRAVAAADEFDAVLVQHEFGIYPGPDGAAVVTFVDRCRSPCSVCCTPC